MRLKAAIEGSLETYMKAEMKAAEKAVLSGVKRASEGLKLEMRRQVTGAGLGRRLANTWRGRVYGNKGIDSAGLVYTRAPVIMRAHDEGMVVRGRDGLWLAIPTENAPKRGVGRKRISPSTFPEYRYGPLRFVYRGSGKPSLLVVDNVRASHSRKTGALRGFRKASKTSRRTGRGLATVVMFIMVSQVRLRKRLDFAGAAARWQNKLSRLIAKAWNSGV